ncbi:MULTISPECIES: 23S rRNA pseudouridine(955/2504/2580) synthase RluC [Candidatus Williamhamiltonella]|nr:23S rRNA pseudouridine(955/2504/2580) synthase RluC [Candidatus Hamiltonella defensa]
MEFSSSVQSITISDDNAGQRIDNFLIRFLKGVPKSMLYRILRKGEVRVNKKRIKPCYKLLTGDMLRIPPIKTAIIQNKPISIKCNKVVALAQSILFEDPDILILNKPSGMAVHGGSGLSFGVIEALRALRPDQRFLHLVHRLDRETSGILMVAKKPSALRSLNEQLRLKTMKKEYLALVAGDWPLSCKLIQAPLQKNILQNGERIVKVSHQGKESQTHFEIEERFTNTTLMKVRPLTGRTHQIRVHALHAGHPIVFDDRYGDPEFEKKLKGCHLNRLFLHALSLEFVHPHSGETIQIKAPLDNSLRHCLQFLRHQK